MSEEEESAPEISLRAIQRARDLVGKLCPYFDGDLKQAEFHEVRSLVEDFCAEEEDRTAEEVAAFKYGHRLMVGLSSEAATAAIQELAAALNSITWLVKSSRSGIDQQYAANAIAAGDRIKTALKKLGAES